MAVLASCLLFSDPSRARPVDFEARSGNGAIARAPETRQPPPWPNGACVGCREPQHPRLGARVVIRHPYVGKSRPSVTQAEAPRWPITAPMSALSATRAGRWPRHGPRGPMGSVGSGLAPLGPARHLPGPTIGLDAPFPAATAQGAAPVFFLRRCLEPFGGYWELGLLLAANHRPGPAIKTHERPGEGLCHRPPTVPLRLPTQLAAGSHCWCRGLGW